MKKILLVIVIIVALIIAAFLFWKIVFPFLGWTLGGIFGGMGSLFDNMDDFLRSLSN
ncbi:MAG: hypothetical protein ACI4JB_09310 [Porcipelethomonas sp.]